MSKPEETWLSCGCETLKDHWFHVDIGLCS
jgi:hypothetical protein